MAKQLSGDSLQSDLVPEPLERFDAASDGALALTVIEVGGTELVVGRASRDEVVGDHEDLVTDGDHGLAIAAMTHDAAVAGAESRVGCAPGSPAGPHERHAQPPAALAG